MLSVPHRCDDRMGPAAVGRCVRQRTDACLSAAQPAKRVQSVRAPCWFGSKRLPRHRP